ncbi:hypothetical protein DFO77_14124 [Marinilabilia salmonicolor]|uniref:Uncharacterized protein n=1 Tax=Marinilabilia salmonicolor TaxID=989 RepID=A0A368UJ81_9BACT|nr:hypothetical protein DFO77_14124 [Marinilabilia salmonicolor]
MLELKISVQVVSELLLQQFRKRHGISQFFVGKKKKQNYQFHSNNNAADKKANHPFGAVMIKIPVGKPFGQNDNHWQ